MANQKKLHKDDLAFLSATVLAKKIATKKISSLELLNYYLGRIEKINPEINAIVVLDIKNAKKQARLADKILAKGDLIGPLHGLPITVKDSYDVKGLPSTHGNIDLKNNIANKDAISIERLKNAGAIIFGKTNVPLNLADMQSYNEIYGTTNNPWDLTRTPGGSSGGSAAALAAGLTGLDFGSDIGGSIRIPAHFCGVFGHKPTFNIITKCGHNKPGVLVESDLSVLGPLGRTVKDIQLGLKVMLERDTIESRGIKVKLPTTHKKKLSDYKVAFWKNEKLAPVDDDVMARIDAVAKTISKAGGKINFHARPNFKIKDQIEIFRNLLWGVIGSRSSEQEHNEMKAQLHEKNIKHLDANTKYVFQAKTQSYWQYEQFNNERQKLRLAWDDFFKEYDAIIMPIMPTAAFKHDHSLMSGRFMQVGNQQIPYFDSIFWNGIAICSYLPATAIPTGLNSSGLPIGVQIVGREYGDLNILKLAELLEKVGYCFVAPSPYLDRTIDPSTNIAA